MLKFLTALLALVWNLLNLFVKGKAEDTKHRDELLEEASDAVKSRDVSRINAINDKLRRS